MCQQVITKGKQQIITHCSHLPSVPLAKLTFFNPHINPHKREEELCGCPKCHNLVNEWGSDLGVTLKQRVKILENNGIKNYQLKLTKGVALF